jgi:hypothetical protein
MSGKNTAVFGLYPDHASAENGVETLKLAGFRNTDISVLFPENVGSKDFGHEKRTKAPEGAATGAGSGAVLGGALGWLVGIGALAIPGLGPFVAAGPIMAALAGMGVGGAAGGSRVRSSAWDARIWPSAMRGRSATAESSFRAFGRSELDEAREGDLERPGAQDISSSAGPRRLRRAIGRQARPPMSRQ